MTLEDRYKPNIAIHPGKTLEDILEGLEMTQVQLAQRMGLTAKTINEIIQGKNSITPETAIKLSAVFGMSSVFWNNLERNYMETLARLKTEEKLTKEIYFLKDFTCYSELSKLGYISKTNNKKDRVINLLNFFEVSSLNLVPKVQAVAFRRVKQKGLLKESLAAWLKCGEIEAKKIRTDIFDRKKLIASLNEIRRLTKEKPAVFQIKLVKICASFGVAVVFIPYFKNTYVNAATKWLSSNKAMIQFSLRGKRMDIFWFDFFHELAHLLRHGKKEQFIEFEEKSCDEKEKKADAFACDTLIPKLEYSTFIRKKDFSDFAIKDFASRLKISPSIVAGRLSHDNKDFRKWDHLRTRLEFKKVGS